MNIIKTRVVLFETDVPAYNYVIESINEKQFEIVAVVEFSETETSNVSCPCISFEQILDFSFWDLLVINDSGIISGQINSLLFDAGIPQERYFFLSRQISDVAFYRSFFKPFSLTGKMVEYFIAGIEKKYFSLSVGCAEFITNTTDFVIPCAMYLTRKTFSQDEIDIFIALAEQYYSTSPSEDCYFFDIGANIGTTCIYVKKRFLPNVKIVAFEPVYENYKLLLTNMIINDISDYSVHNLAVADQCTSYTMRINASNMGGGAIVGQTETAQEEGGLTETVDAVTIEKYLMENNIDPSKVRYVWIDTEGFEPEVLSASLPLLEQANTAVYLEYSPCLVSKDKLHSLYEICRPYFKRFICIDDYVNGETDPRPIEELRELYKRYPEQTNVFLIKR